MRVHKVYLTFFCIGNYVYYTVANELNRPFKILKRKIGDENPPIYDKEIHVDSDSTHYLDIGVSKDKVRKYFLQFRTSPLTLTI